VKKKIKFKPGDLVKVYDVQWADGQMWMMSGDWIAGVEE